MISIVSDKNPIWVPLMFGVALTAFGGAGFAVYALKTL